jgi:1,2-diacylglycerol 3-alpha-glucosyltransferase
MPNDANEEIHSMNIAMFANAYEPVIGGLERSIATFTEDFRASGHRVLIVTLTFPGAEDSDDSVFRLPAIKEVAGTEFSIKLPVPAGLKERLDAFTPDIIHSHHPFMVGDTALRVARRRGLPLVFTHHTLYERYAYRFSRESEGLKRIAAAIATEYANLCDLVVAPTNSIKQMVRGRGVHVPVEIIPTGIDVDQCQSGSGSDFRREHTIPREAFVLGYLGRVVDAKNMAFLTRAVIQILTEYPDTWFLIAGEGDAADGVRRQIREAGVADRVVMTGPLHGRAVADAYAAMDVFAFASKTETQGIVLVESLCAGVPVVALDAPGTRDILLDGKTGPVLDGDASSEQFAAAIRHVKEIPERLNSMRKEARRRAREFDRTTCAERLLDAYRRLCEFPPHPRIEETGFWLPIQEGVAAEWDLFKSKLAVAAAAVSGVGERERPERE